MRQFTIELPRGYYNSNVIFPINLAVLTSRDELSREIRHVARVFFREILRAGYLGLEKKKREIYRWKRFEGSSFVNVEGLIARC